jgi:hypothetical protein
MIHRCPGNPSGTTYLVAFQLTCVHELIEGGAGYSQNGTGLTGRVVANLNDWIFDFHLYISKINYVKRINVPCLVPGGAILKGERFILDYFCAGPVGFR